MRYAVIYQSKSGNTQRVAEQIFKSLSSEQKLLCNLDTMTKIPESDVYFIGFGIHNGSCSLDMINCMEQITGGRLVLFVTCGGAATQQYKERLETRLEIWLPERAEYLGMFLCQGNVDSAQRDLMLRNMPEKEEALTQLFEMGSAHPDKADLENAAWFTQQIEKAAEKRTVPIH